MATYNSSEALLELWHVMHGQGLGKKTAGAVRRVLKNTRVKKYEKGAAVVREIRDLMKRSDLTLRYRLESVYDAVVWAMKNLQLRTANPRVDRRGSWRGDFFRVSVSAAEVDDFADQWPGSGMHDRDGFAAEFHAATGDLVDLEGWPATGDTEGVDQAALSALIDDMRDFGMKQKRRTNPATRGRRRRKIESKAQWRKLAAMMTRGEISKKDFDDMVKASKPFDRLPARKGRKSKRRRTTRRR